MGESKRKKKDETESSDSDMDTGVRNIKIKRTGDRLENIPPHVNSVYISLTDPEKDIKKYIFSMYKQISGVVGQIGNSRVCRDNKVWVEVLNREDLVRILGMKSIINGQVKIKVEPAVNIGTSVGIVYAPEVFEYEEEEIKQFAESKYEIINIKRLNKGKDKKKTPLLKITFSHKNIPEKMKIGFQYYTVKQYYPPPQRCYVCFKYGHFGKICRNGIRCMNCGESHETERCTNMPNCINCKKDHTAIDPNCEILKQEKEIVKIKIDRALSFREARQMYHNMHQSYKDKLMTNTAKGNKDIEEINDTINKEIKKIEQHITPDIVSEIKTVIQNAIKDIVGKITIKHKTTEESMQTDLQHTTNTNLNAPMRTDQNTTPENSMQKSTIKLNNGHKLKVTNQKASTSQNSTNNG